jgi:hypothetical protein
MAKTHSTITAMRVRGPAIKRMSTVVTVAKVFRTGVLRG